jgi:hypothetical protein
MREAEEASGRDKSVLEAKAGKVKTKLDDALTKVSAIEVAPLPKVEVSVRVRFEESVRLQFEKSVTAVRARAKSEGRVVTAGAAVHGRRACRR